MYVRDTGNYPFYQLRKAPPRKIQAAAEQKEKKQPKTMDTS